MNFQNVIETKVSENFIGVDTTGKLNHAKMLTSKRLQTF